MKKSADGSADLCFAPRPPAEMVSNWIPTGEDLFLLFRLPGLRDAVHHLAAIAFNSELRALAEVYACGA